MKKYTIYRGWHYCFFLIGRLFGWHYNKKKFKIRFKFDERAWWTPPRNNDDYDLNKLAGKSFWGVHKNSVRLTWVPDFDIEGVVDIYGYTYDSSINTHTAKYLCSVSCGIEQAAILELHDDFYGFALNGRFLQMENKTKDSKLQKELYPFIGGQNTAIRTMNIYTKVESIK